MSSQQQQGARPGTMGIRYQSRAQNNNTSGSSSVSSSMRPERLLFIKSVPARRLPPAPAPAPAAAPALKTGEVLSANALRPKIEYLPMRTPVRKRASEWEGNTTTNRVSPYTSRYFDSVTAAIEHKKKAIPDIADITNPQTVQLRRLEEQLVIQKYESALNAHGPTWNPYVDTLRSSRNNMGTMESIPSGKLPSLRIEGMVATPPVILSPVAASVSAADMNAAYASVGLNVPPPTRTQRTSSVATVQQNWNNAGTAINSPSANVPSWER